MIMKAADAVYLTAGSPGQTATEERVLQNPLGDLYVDHTREIPREGKD